MIKKNKILTNEFNKSSTNFPQSHDKKKQDYTKTNTQLYRSEQRTQTHLARGILFSNKDTKKIQQMVLVKLDTHMYKNENRPLSLILMKIKPKRSNTLREDLKQGFCQRKE